jgi:hypothetical protein
MDSESLRQAATRIKHLKSQNHRSDTPRTFPRINNQHDWQLEQLGDLCATTNFRAPALAVEQPHHAFSNDNVGAPRPVPQDTSVGLSPQHPRIKVARRSTAGPCVMAGIEKVGPAFERLHRKPAPSQTGYDRKRNCRLSHATRSA